MTRTRKSLLLTALLVVSAATAGVTGIATSSVESGVQAQDDGVSEVGVDSGATFWQGQFLRFSAGEASASQTWAVHRVQNGEVGQLATEVLLDGSGSAVFSTSNLDGEYVVVNADGQPVVVRNGSVQNAGSVGEASFEIGVQSLDATFADAVVQNAEGSAAQTDLRVQSNRGGYGFYLLSDGLSASQLAEIFSAVEVRDGQAVATRNASDDAVYDADFTGVEAGTYNVTVFAADGTAQDSASIRVTQPVEGTASLSNGSITEQRGDVVRFDVTFDGTDRATVAVGSEQVGYRARFTVTDADGDGTATVELDTFRAGLSPETPGISVTGQDELADYQLVTDPIPDQLDAATYPIELSVGATRTDVGSILLTERSTDGVQVWTAPDSVNVDSVAGLAEVATQDQDVAYQDWAVVQVQASGLYSYVQNISDLNNESTGVSMTLTRVGEINQPARQVPLDQGRLFVDESGNQFFLVFDSNALERGATYEANFTVSAANPYVEAGDGTSLVTNFSVVERNVSFDQPVRVPASSDVTISGNSSVAPGTELTVEAANVAQNPFLKRQTATVSPDGTWQATFDFSDVPTDTNFTVSTNEPVANATGVVVAGDAGQATTTAAGETTTTAVGAAGETTTAEETTTEAADGVAGAETTAAAGAETTTAAEETTTTETTAAAASAPASGFGAVPVLVGLVALLAAGAVALRRR